MASEPQSFDTTTATGVSPSGADVWPSPHPGGSRNAALIAPSPGALSTSPKVLVALHDGFYGCTSGSGFSNRAFLEVLAETLPHGRLIVTPVHVPPSDPSYDPNWAADTQQLLQRAEAEVVPIPGGRALPGTLSGSAHLCGYVADIAHSRLAGPSRSQLIGLDTPLLGLAPHLEGLSTELMLLPRSTTKLAAPHDHRRIHWEREGITAAVGRRARITAISQHMHMHLKHSYGVPESALIDLPNGLVLRDSTALPLALPLPPRARAGFLFALGRAVESKGFEDLLQAIVHLRGEGVQVPHLVLAAVSHSRLPTRHQGRLRALIGEHALDATLLTRFSPAYRSWLRSPAVRAVIVPSRSEPFGRVPLDAFAAGAAPVVATRAGGLIETVIDDETGFTAEPQNPSSLAAAIHRALVMSTRDRDWMRRAGQALLATQHDYGATVRNYIQQHVSWALEAAPITSRPA